MAATTVPWERFSEATRVSASPAPIDASEDLAQYQRDQDTLKLARERFEIARIAEDHRRSEMMVDLKFRCGQQWDEEIAFKRKQQGRPCLTINRINGFLKHVLNSMRQARPEIKVDPVGDGADEDIAEIRQGLIRHILVNSRAEVPFDTAFENMSTMGLGWMRVVDGWADPQSFDKDLFVEWVPNTFSVYSDPSARKPDWSDAKWRFIVDDLSLAEFRAKYGKEREAVSASNFQSIGDHAPSWLINGKIRVAEYFHVEEEQDTLCEMPDGSTRLLSQIDDGLIGQIVRERKTVVSKVVWTLMSGVEILKERVWPGKYIPVIPVIGNQIELDGERILVGMVRYAQESQRMFNYMYSCFVEAVALAPKSPFIAEFDQVSEFRDIWERANTDIVSLLPYKAKSVDGQLVPPPQRQQAEPPVAAFVNGLKLADENLKSTFSIFDASLGQRGPQESGIAINSRKIESDVATYDWIDNFTRALTFLGLVLNDLLEHFYNTPGRIVQITQEDLSKKPITLNQLHGDEGRQKIYDLRQGKFGITTSTGPSFSTRRQEASKSMLEVAKVYPPLWQVAGPLLVKAMDWPQKDAIAAQLEKAMPPELREPDPDGPPPVPPQAQQQMAQMNQMIQAMSKMLSEATDKKESERQAEEWETFRTQMVQETQLAIAQLKTGSQEAQALMLQEFKHIQSVLESQLIDGAPSPASSSSSSAPASAATPQPPAPAPPAPAMPGGPPPGSPMGGGPPAGSVPPM